MSYNTRETSEIHVSSKIDRTALTETLLKLKDTLDLLFVLLYQDR